MKESSIERSFVRVAKQRVWVTFKLYGVVGIPDRVVLCSGKAVFLEFKTPDGVLSMPQKSWLNELRGHGFKAAAVSSLTEAVEVCEKEFKRS